MIDRDRNVSEDELHAYVDGELPADRRGAVEAWLATHPDDAAKVAAWRSQAELIRARYGAVAEEKPPHRLDIGAADCAAAPARSPPRPRPLVAAFLVGGVAGWTARGVEARVAVRPQRASPADALDAYRLYVVEVRHPVEVPGDQRPHLVEWLSKRVGSPLRAPRTRQGGTEARRRPAVAGPDRRHGILHVRGARRASASRSIAAAPAIEETALRYTTGEQNAAYYWVDGNLAYVLQRPGGARQAARNRPGRLRSDRSPQPAAGRVSAVSGRLTPLS